MYVTRTDVLCINIDQPLQRRYPFRTRVFFFIPRARKTNRKKGLFFRNAERTHLARQNLILLCTEKNSVWYTSRSGSRLCKTTVERIYYNFPALLFIFRSSFPLVKAPDQNFEHQRLPLCSKQVVVCVKLARRQ